MGPNANMAEAICTYQIFSYFLLVFNSFAFPHY